LKKLSSPQWIKIDKIIKNALKEDIGSGDITTEAIFDKYKLSSAVITAKESGILAGIDVVMRVFKLVDFKLIFKTLVSDGERIFPNLKVAKIKGDIRSILMAERTALNFLGRMSGVATFTYEFVKRIEGTNAKILDTRKTAPNLRILDKYAVSVGGGFNHRMGLYDMFLIKDNHIKAMGSLDKAVKKAIEFRKLKRKNWKIEVEAENIKQVKEVLSAKVDRIMLDNMNLEMIKKSVELVNKKAEVEVSGNVNLDVIRDIALTGVDFISIGSLTHSIKNLDFSLLIV
jgi:nicotinate-nucleotide pyrophosphorylase (carboxylating)